MQQVSLSRRVIRLVPMPIKDGIRRMQRSMALRSSVGQFKRVIAQATTPSRALFERLEFGWANDWSAKPALLQVVVSEALHAKSVLECGSGISSILLSIIASVKKTHYKALEHHQKWFDALRLKERALGVDEKGLVFAPLKSYGDLDWYDMSSIQPDERFDLVLCDGPPGATKGGRSGLLPVAGKHLLPGARIIVDDASRAAEAAMISQWIENYGMRMVLKTPQYAILAMPG